MRAPARIFTMLSIALALSPLVACKKRFDGTCKVDGDCLEFQKCASGICVRAKPIFEAYVPPPAPQAPAAPKKPRWKAPADQPEEQPPPVERKATPPKQELGPAVPRQRDPQSARKFRLDA